MNFKDIGPSDMSNISNSDDYSEAVETTTVLVVPSRRSIPWHGVHEGVPTRDGMDLVLVGVTNEMQPQRSIGLLLICPVCPLIQFFIRPLSVPESEPFPL